MKFLRATMGIKRSDKIRNDVIRNELKVDNLNNTIKNYREKWYAHIERMDDNRLTKRIFNYKPKSKLLVGLVKDCMTNWNPNRLTGIESLLIIRSVVIYPLFMTCDISIANPVILVINDIDIPLC